MFVCGLVGRPPRKCGRSVLLQDTEESQPQGSWQLLNVRFLLAIGILANSATHAELNLFLRHITMEVVIVLPFLCGGARWEGHHVG